MQHKRPRRSRQELLSCAYHEAGHAVASLVLGLYVARVDIRRTADSFGCCSIVGPDGYIALSRRERRDAARKFIVACFAGAPARALIDPIHADDGCEMDEILVQIIATGGYGVIPRTKNGFDEDACERYLDKLRRVAAELIRRHEIAVEKLASELMICESIEGQDLWVWALINGVAVGKYLPLKPVDAEC